MSVSEPEREEPKILNEKKKTMALSEMHFLQNIEMHYGLNV